MMISKNLLFIITMACSIPFNINALAYEKPTIQTKLTSWFNKRRQKRALKKQASSIIDNIVDTAEEANKACEQFITKHPNAVTTIEAVALFFGLLILIDSASNLYQPKSITTTHIVY